MLRGISNFDYDGTEFDCAELLANSYSYVVMILMNGSVIVTADALLCCATGDGSGVRFMGPTNSITLINAQRSNLMSSRIVTGADLKVV